jgi:hypothetical protein
MSKDKSKEKQVEMIRDGLKVQVPESAVPSRLVHGYEIVKAKEGDK